MAGLDVTRFLNDELDMVELATMRRVAARVRELREQERAHLAVLIRNQIVEGFGG